MAKRCNHESDLQLWSTLPYRELSDIIIPKCASEAPSNNSASLHKFMQTEEHSAEFQVGLSLCGELSHGAVQGLPGHAVRSLNDVKSQ